MTLPETNAPEVHSRPLLAALIRVAAAAYPQRASDAEELLIHALIDAGAWRAILHDAWHIAPAIPHGQGAGAERDALYKLLGDGLYLLLALADEAPNAGRAAALHREARQILGLAGDTAEREVPSESR